MHKDTNSSNDSLIPPLLVPEEIDAFPKRMHGLMDGHPKDDATVAKAFEGMDDTFDLIAAGLYQMASMLVGEGEETIRLTETVIATTEASACHDPANARKMGKQTLCGGALDLLAQRNHGCLAVPEGLTPPAPCIEDDDLHAAGLTSEELERVIKGPERKRWRQWLEQLPTLLRTIFVLRAVAGFTGAETATLLAAHGGPGAAGWTPDAVRDGFRQALCSLASQLIQASAAR